MRAFWNRHRKLHGLLLAELILLAVFFVLHTSRAAMEWLAQRMGAVRRGLGNISYCTDASVLEILTILVVAVTAGYLVWSVIAVLRAPQKRQRLYTAVLGGACAGLAALVCFFYLWGANFYIDGFQERSGIYAEDVAPEDLFLVTVYFVQQLHETADRVERDENGNFCVSAEQILADSPTVYDPLERQFPFLELEDRPPKAMRFSRVMSRLDFTGMYCAYAGESSVNVDCPTSLLPATVCHELAHQRGFTSELECNFLGILASTTSGDPNYAYSGWLEGYIYLGNALYQLNYDLWEAVYYALPEGVKADLRQNNAYWDQFRESRVKEVSNQVYDEFLKTYGQPAGLQSYGMVVDLLVAYYKDQLR